MTKYKEAYKIPPSLRTEGIPSSEFSLTFLQGMVNRMGVSFHKYGKVKDGYPSPFPEDGSKHPDALRSLVQRLEMYRETHNTEYLIDAANFAMIEFMRSRFKDAFFEGTDSEGSPGRTLNTGLITSKGNLDLR